MHSHGNPKGGAKNFAAGQPCKIGECNLGQLRRHLACGNRPANAGTHSRRQIRCVRQVQHRACDEVTRYSACAQETTISRYRFALACSAELCAASASLAEIAAVSAGLPQLGASLPSPQARGR